MPPGSPTLERSVCLVSLGCSKALVDSEVMVGHLQRAGLTLVSRPQDSDVVIINTKWPSADVLARYALEHKEPLAPGKLPGKLVRPSAKAH